MYPEFYSDLDEEERQAIPEGQLYLERDGFTYHLYDRTYFNSLHRANIILITTEVGLI